MASRSSPGLSPVAVLVMALRFLEAADQLQGSQDTVPEHFPVTHYLLGHSIELALKAYLTAEGVPARDLSNRNKFGHNLVACLSAANEKGLASMVTLSAQEIASIEALNEVYETKQLEYSNEVSGQFSIMTIPTTAPLRSAARKLTSQLRPHCLVALKRLQA